MPGVGYVLAMERRKRKREQASLEISLAEKIEVIEKSARLTDDSRVRDYINKRSLYVTPPIRHHANGSRVRTHVKEKKKPHLEQDTVTEGKTRSTEVEVYEKTLKVTLTRESKVIQEWIGRQNEAQFGLDLEWQPNMRKGQKENMVALLQISSDSECLLVQMLFLDEVPAALVQFLKDPEIKLVGVGIRGDTKKLERDYGLVCGGEVELTTLAAAQLKDNELRRAGLKSLASRILGFNMTKRKSVTLSNWSNSQLSRDQLEYATMDAWVALAILCGLQRNTLDSEI